MSEEIEGEPLRAQAPPTALGLASAGWGLAAIAAALARAVFELASGSYRALAAGDLAPWQWSLVAGWIGAMCLFQGYFGFQRGFSARVVARAAHLTRHADVLDLALAPLYCIGLLRASRRRMRASGLLVAIMFGLVALVSNVPQPYRGAIGAGVAAGLAWGLVAMIVFAAGACLGRPPRSSLDLPERASPGAPTPLRAAGE